MFDRRNPLESQLAADGRDGADGQRALHITVVQGWDLALLAAYGDDAAYRAALRPALGAQPLLSPRDAQDLPQGRLFNTAPGQHWLVTTQPALVAATAAALPAHVGSCTSLSHSRVRVAVSGAAAASVLSKGIAVDLDPGVFTIGQFVQTGLHHSGVLLHRAAPQRYELYLPRTFAQSLWEWLVDAALPLGYHLGVENSGGV